MKERDFHWFDRTFKPIATKPNVQVTVVCNGKCRAGAIDPACLLHGVWKSA